MLQTAAFDPSADPALAKPVTVHLALRPVREIVRAMGKASGQSIETSSTVADLKATVLVKGLPVGRTMEALSDTLGLTWRKEDDGTYRLLKTTEEGKAIDAYLAEERTRASSSDVAKGALASAVAAGANDAAPAVPIINRRGNPRRRANGAEPATPAVRFDPNLLAVEGTKTEPPSRLEPAAVTGSSEFAKANAAWPSIEKGLDPAWNKPMRPLALPASTWENGSYTLSDLLTAWHDATDLPVVADAFRISMRTGAPTQTWALASLQGLAQGDRLSLRIANGVARLRHPAYWRLREQEVSESAWNNLERSKTPTISDYASFASGLTTAQAAAFRSMEAPLSKVPTEAVRQAYPALRLWASLSDAAQNALLAGRPVPLSAVGGTDAYVFALREAPYYRSGDPTVVLAMNASQLGLFGTSGGKTFTLRLGPVRGGGVDYVIALP